MVAALAAIALTCHVRALYITARVIARTTGGSDMSILCKDRSVLFFKKEPKNFCLFGSAPGESNEDWGRHSAGAKVFWFFFSKKNTSSSASQG